jgi:hypothetical protein
VPDGNGGYKDRLYMTSLVGFAPAEDPQYVVLTLFDEPKTNRMSSANRSVFKKAMMQVLTHYRIMPSNGDAPAPRHPVTRPAREEPAHMIRMTLAELADAVGGTRARSRRHGRHDRRRRVDTDSREIGPVTSSSPSPVRSPTDTSSSVPRPKPAPPRDRRAPRGRADLADHRPRRRPGARGPRPHRRRARARRGDLRVVGITGSNGKTTTKNLVRILQDEGETVAPRNSFNNDVGAPLTMLRVTGRRASS